MAIHSRWCLWMDEGKLIYHAWKINRLLNDDGWVVDIHGQKRMV